jgi:hypothetical protein
MKRLANTTAVLREAGRGIDPMTGSVLDAIPNFDPQLLPHADWPISPRLQRAISGCVSDAIHRSLSLRETVDIVRRTLEGYSIRMTDDDVHACIGANTISLS